MGTIKVSVDVNVNLSEETKQFFASLFSGKTVSTSAQPISVAQPAAPVVPAKPATTTAAAKPVVPATTTNKPAEQPTPGKPNDDDKASVDIETVRAALAEKVNQHRAEIKEKLTELGAKNVTTLCPAKYNEMYDFLTNLA